MKLKIEQIESRFYVEVDGIVLPDIFQGYKIESSNSGEFELSLIIREGVNVSGLSANLKAQKR